MSIVATCTRCRSRYHVSPRQPPFPCSKCGNFVHVSGEPTGQQPNQPKPFYYMGIGYTALAIAMVSILFGAFVLYQTISIAVPPSQKKTQDSTTTDNPPAQFYQQSDQNDPNRGRPTLD